MHYKLNFLNWFPFSSLFVIELFINFHSFLDRTLIRAEVNICARDLASYHPKTHFLSELDENLWLFLQMDFSQKH